MNIQPSNSAFSVTREDPHSQVRDAFRRLRMRTEGSHLISWSFPAGNPTESKSTLRFSIDDKQTSGDRVIIRASYTPGDKAHSQLDFLIALTCTGEVHLPPTDSTTNTNPEATKALARIQECLPFVYNGVSV